MTDAVDGFTPVLKVAEVPTGTMRLAALDRTRVLVAQVEGRFYAVSDICGHRNAPLSRGKLNGHIVECPLHFAQFDVRTGQYVDGPQSADVRRYEVRVENDMVYIRP
ncbi:MAG: non-heme iron oxygenase ferredoxin subunit [Alphaproteobacteria bacterium]|nr:non-heme iron oxygenase ferredoxin subunit [Alphaproteobacteria bacterium]